MSWQPEIEELERRRALVSAEDPAFGRRRIGKQAQRLRSVRRQDDCVEQLRMARGIVNNDAD